MTPDKTPSPTDAELDAILCNQWPAFASQATLVRIWVRQAMRDAVAVFGDTTQQPTQAQAGAVPLTQAKVVEAFCALPHQVQFITAFDQGVRFAERHHGIKGGQHG